MLTITLPEKTETWLKDEASRRGTDASKLAAEIIEKASSKPNGNEATDPTIALLRKWMEEDATDDPEELERQRNEGEEFMKNLARNRSEMDGPNARILWP